MPIVPVVADMPPIIQVEREAVIFIGGTISGRGSVTTVVNAPSVLRPRYDLGEPDFPEGVNYESYHPRVPAAAEGTFVDDLDFFA